MTRNTKSMWRLASLRPMRKICSAVAIVLLIGIQAFVQSASPAPGDVERRVEAVLSRMTLEEKIDMLGGVDDFFIRALPRLGLPRLKMADGPVGVRNFGPATAMAGGIALAATWNPALAERVGTEIGRDAKAKGAHFLLGPGVNIYRAPMNGRNFEYFGEDPFLASRIAVGYVKGVQSQGVSATIKHFMGNNSEFEWLVRDQTDLSIPRYNQEGRQVALQGARESMVLLKNEGNLLPLNKERIKSVLIVGPDAYPAVPVGGGSAQVRPFAATSFLEGLSNYLGTAAQVYYKRGMPALSEMAEATHFSTAAASGQPGLHAEYFDHIDLQVSPVRTRTEQHVNFRMTSGSVFPEQTLSARWTGYYIPQSSGSYDIFVESTGEDGGSYRLYVDDKLAFDNWTTSRALVNCVGLSLEARPHKVVLEHRGRSMWLGARLALGIVRQGNIVDSEAKALAAKADVVVVAAGFDPETESEGADRTFRLPPGQDEFIQEMVAANKNTIVVLTAGGNVDMNAWLDRVPALVQAWYPGQEGGTALAEILFGDVNPSGRLPVTFERHWEQNPTHDSYYAEAGTNRIVYKEGVFLGYRAYQHNGTKPLFPFGYGLSYSTFSYGTLSITPATTTDGKVTVSFDVTNTGKREGAEVAQVYVGDTHAKVPRPAKELKGFAKVRLRPGESKRVTVTLDRRALSYYDVNSKQWRAELGEYDILVGRSVEQIELRGKLTLAGSAALASAGNP